MCTEKSYGGSNGISKGKAVSSMSDKPQLKIKETKNIIEEESEEINIETSETLPVSDSAQKSDNKKISDNYKKAGHIARQVKEYIKQIVRKNEKLLELAEKIEEKTRELGGKPAFPTNLSIDDIAAHFTPAYNDESKAHGLLKIDYGVHVNGCIVDTAISLDLENNEENKKLIQAAEKALEKAIEQIKNKKSISEIGKSIHDEIVKHNFSPIRNLSGHSVSEYHIHAGVTIPNYENNNPKILEKGVYAIEPFSTTGEGVVYDSSLSGIYRLEKITGVRDSLAREILSYIEKEYRTLPFCARWIVKKFGSRALLSLRFLEQAQIIHQYSQLVEKGHGKVAQAEHTILIDDKIEVLT